MKSVCHHHQIWMDYLYDAIFKMTASEVKLRFRLLLCYSTSRIDRDKIFGSKPMLYTWCQGDAGCMLGVSSVMGYILCVRVVQVVTLV